MPETLTIPGRPDFVTIARAGIRTMLAHAPDDARDAAELVTSEFVTNAIRWTQSGDADGEVRILVDPDPDGASVRIEVGDDGRRRGRVDEWDGDPDQHGRGLEIVGAVAKEWGHRSERGRGVYWAVIAWG